jgi:hypothetical protein
MVSVTVSAAVTGLGLSFLSLYTLSKMLSPAAEAFRMFVLRHGEASLLAQFERYLPMAPAKPDAARRTPVGPSSGRAAATIRAIDQGKRP